MAAGTPTPSKGIFGEDLRPLVAGDYFDRQRCVPQWDHSVIENQVAFVCGAGGIGNTVALALCRLGIKKLHLLDKDTVDATNLNRQVLFSKGHVGMTKVEAAKDGLEKAHNLRTEIVTHHMDAVKNWGTVVEIAKECTVLFNCIDFGEYFDYAFTSLSVSLGIPYATASSYGHTAIAEHFTGRPDGPCWGCSNQPKSNEVTDQITPDKIQSYTDLSGILLRDTPVQSRSVGSSVLPCSIASQLAVTAWANAIFNFTLPNWSTFNLCTFEMFSFPVEKNPDCKLCSKGKPAESSEASQPAPQ